MLVLTETAHKIVWPRVCLPLFLKIGRAAKQDSGKGLSEPCFFGILPG